MTATSPPAPSRVLKDPRKAAEQAVRMVCDCEIISRHGKKVKVDVHTLCVHGDEAAGVAVAREIRTSLENAGVSIVPLPEMRL
jgi:5-oxoprolinase (ATP-hydrolysing) subunit A